MNPRTLYVLVAGTLAAALVYAIPLKGLDYSGHAVLALLVFAIIMWISEVIPMAVTSLLVLFMQPVLGITSFEKAIYGFASPILFLLLGGFIIAEGLHKSGLIERITRAILSKLGTSSERILLAVILSTGILSAWIENVAAFTMTLPLVRRLVSLVGVHHHEKSRNNFAKAMVLGASYGSLAGGFATQIGTVPNLLASAYTKLSFLKWMIFGIPLAIMMMLVTWGTMSLVFPSQVKKGIGKDTILSAVDELGPVTGQEKLASGILLFVIGLWVTTEFTGLSSFSIALVGGALFFLSGILTWNDVQRSVDWGILIFLGGALSLGSALYSTGAAKVIVELTLAGLGKPPPMVTLVVLMILAAALTQVVSNAVLAAVLIPSAVTVASSTNSPPAFFAVAMAMACSLSFMSKLADPTVAIASGTKYVNAKEILWAGFLTTTLGLLVTTLVLFTVAMHLVVG